MCACACVCVRACVLSDSGEVKLHPSLFLLLLVLGRLYPSPMDGSSSPLGLAPFMPFIIRWLPHVPHTHSYMTRRSRVECHLGRSVAWRFGSNRMVYSRFIYSFTSHLLKAAAGYMLLARRQHKHTFEHGPFRALYRNVNRSFKVHFLWIIRRAYMRMYLPVPVYPRIFFTGFSLCGTGTGFRVKG